MRTLDVLLDQLPLILSFALAVAFLLLVVHLGVAPLTLGVAGYVLLLALVTLAVLLGVDALRKSAFRRELGRRLASGEVSTPAALPHPASREQRAMTSLLQRSQAEAVERAASLRRIAEEHRTFIDLWVHQMKTPVNVLQLAAERRDDGSWDDVSEEAARLAGGLDLMLATARLERFELDYAPADTDLMTSVKGVFNELRGAFIRGGVYPKLSGEAGVTAVTDPKWLQVVLRQLLTNAVKYSPQGSRVEVSVERQGSGARITVRDEGPGVPAEDVPRVFERYFTGTNGRRYGASTGMGLYLAAEVCRRLGHELSLESDGQVGTAVAITLRNEGVHMFEPTDASRPM